MFDIFKKEIKVSDSVKLYLTIGKEIEGEVIEIGENHVLLKTIDGIQTRFFDKIIGGWDLIASIKQDGKTIQAIKELKIETISINPVEKQPGLKIIGKIDLDKVNSKRVPKILSKPLLEEVQNVSTDEIEIKGTFKSFEELKINLSERENEKLVPANAVIIRHSESRRFGFLRTPTGSEIFFSYRDIVDEELAKRMHGEKQYLNIQVTYSETRNYKGEKATVIHLPWRVSKCFEVAKKKFDGNRFDESLYLCNQILSAFPNNYLAFDLSKEIENRKSGVIRKSKYAEPIYLKGKKAKDIKNYDEAIRLLKISIDKKEKLDSAIKDLASCYQELDEIGKGIELIETHLGDLPDNSSTYNFISNYYSAAKKYNAAIIYLDKLVSLIPKYKLVDVLSRKMYCLIQLKKYEDALDIIDEILLINQNFSLAIKWKRLIEDAIETGHFDLLDSDSDYSVFSSLSGGISRFLQFRLDNCAYTGLTIQEINKKSFNKENLINIRKVIDDTSRSRPKERAPLFLTEAKLLQDIEPENEEIFRSTLSKYCNTLATNFRIDNYPFDIFRYLLFESFTLEREFNNNARQLLYYLYSFKYQSQQILDNTPSKLHDAIKKLPNVITEICNYNINAWLDLLDISVINTNIASRITSILSINQTLLAQAINYFNSHFEIKLPQETKTLNDNWNILREKRRSEILNWFAYQRTLLNSLTLESFCDNFSNNIQFINSSWLNSTDARRLNSIINDVMFSINNYNKNTYFDDKEKFKNLALNQISQLNEEIIELPTRLSYDGFLNVLNHLANLLNHSFKKLLETSIPNIAMHILGDARFIDANNNVTVQLAIQNQRGCSPIQDIKVKLSDDPLIKLLDVVLTSSEPLKGGEERIISIPLNVSTSILEQEAATINVNLEYKSREKEETNFIINQPLALRFFSSEQFETISNPYAAIADSGPVKDRKMFFGREKDIEEISNSILSASTHKFIDIYGQKRSGKSSLLYHLTQKLKESNRFICIDFTLGSTAKYDSASFFWLILEGIERYIETSEPDSTRRPSFETPRLQEILLNPSIIFYEKINDLNKELRKFDLWKDRKLLLLIDEFTYLYSATLRKNLDPEFMKTWKAMLEKGLFSAIVIGQDIMPKFKSKFPNEFGVFEDRRLTYLKKEDAEKLIEKPIWDSKNNKSRFIGKAISKILDYTSLNPYYIQIFCAKLVDFMNDYKLINVTEADVIDVAKSFVEGSQALPIDKFDNLLNAGDADLEAVPQEETLEILRQIANNSRVLGSCPRESISLKSVEYDDQILDDLLKRDVINCPNTDYYRIQVQIFNEWLLKH